MKIELDLNIIKEDADIKEDQNYRFRSFLKRRVSKRVDEEEKGRFMPMELPCLFLGNKTCIIYNIRSGECREYPYLHKNNFSSRLLGVIENYEVCPIVYNVYEGLKQEFSFR